MSAPTRYPNGVGNRKLTDPLGNMGQLDPTKFHTFFDDFLAYTAGDWVVTTTELGAGSATEAVSDANGGVLVLTNAAGDNDLDFLQWAGGAGGVTETFLFEAGKQMWFKSRLKVSDATQSDLVMGLQITDTTPLAVSDGVFFRKDDGDANIDFVVTKNSTISTGVAGTLADDTFAELAFYYDGKSALTAYLNGVGQVQLDATNLPDDELLAVSFGVQNGEAAAKVMSIDYILAVKER